MTLILIHADASQSIGSGHVMRCRTVARELQRRGATISFFGRSQQGDLIDLPQQVFPVLALPELPLASHEALQGCRSYGRPVSTLPTGWWLTMTPAHPHVS